MINELGLNHVNNINLTYANATKPGDKIRSENTSFLKIKFNLEVNDMNKNLPKLNWIPKLHKNPTKARFIIVTPKRSVKPISKAATVGLKLMFNQIKQ